MNQVPWFCVIIIASQLIEHRRCVQNGYGFTYSTFTGPVSGQVEEIVVPVYGDDANKDAESLPPSRVDYVVSVEQHCTTPSCFMMVMSNLSCL